ncbi:MAG: Uma2 family endonuclease [Acidobacteria bacterium]|nr:Uma2 family endonuclease [Acidobacteriota bacterium]
MAAAATTLTLKEFLALPKQEGLRYELVAGEVVTMGNAGQRHERVKANTAEIFTVYNHSHRLGKVYSETMFQLGEAEGRILDVCLLLKERIPEPAEEGIYQGAPALAVEVVSSESAAELERKVESYLAHGSRAVLVLYPDARTVRVYDPSGASRLLRGDQVLQIEWLPGFSAPVAGFFEGL